MKYCIVILLLVQWLLGCDPMRRIDMKNKSSKDAEITWTLKDRDSLYNSPFFISNSRTLTLKLEPEKPKNEIKMTFGMGPWNEISIKDALKYVDSLEIKSSKGLILLGGDGMKRFLMDRKKGVTKRKIEILIKD